ncbi:MAG: hypothetical protein PHE83_18250 [Opitutaceae bacterium]|nr:hypothetical protein [Opitutaceae bacterium]
MADGVDVDNGALTDYKVSSDDAGVGGHVQRVKLAYAADGSEVHVPADADGLLVNLGTNNDVTVTGTVDLGATDNAVLDAIAASLALIDNAIAAGNELQVDVVAALPAGTNAIGKLAANSGVDIGDVDVTSLPGAAHDAAIAGNPVRVAGRALTADYTAVAAGDTADLIATILGKLVSMPYALPGATWQYAGPTGGITDTSDDAIIAAGAAGVRHYLTALTVVNAHATVGTEVVIKDGSTVIHRGYAAAAGGGYTVNFPTPLRGTAATALNAACITTGSATHVSASGFSAAE